MHKKMKNKTKNNKKFEKKKLHKKVAQKSCTRKLIPEPHPPRGPPKNYILCAYPYALAHKLMRSRRTFPAKFISLCASLCASA